MATKKANTLKLGAFYKITDKDTEKDICGFYLGPNADEEWQFRQIDGTILTCNPVAVKYSSYQAALDSAVRACEKKSEEQYGETQTNADMLPYVAVKSYVELIASGKDFGATQGTFNDPYPNAHVGNPAFPESATQGEGASLPATANGEETPEMLFYKAAAECKDLGGLEACMDEHKVKLVHKRHGEVKFIETKPSREVEGEITVTWNTPENTIGGCRLVNLPHHFMPYFTVEAAKEEAATA